MKKILLTALTAAFLVSPFLVSAQSTVPQGGTGTTTVGLGQILFGQGNSLPGSLRFGATTALRFATSTNSLSFLFGSTTALTISGTAYIGSGTGLLLTTSGTVSNYVGTSCVAGQAISSLDASGVASCSTVSTFAFPFTPTTNFGALANSTSTPIWFTQGIQASSTSQIQNASTTRVTVSTELGIPNASSTLSLTANSNSADIQVNSNTSSSSIRYSDGAAIRSLYPDGPAGLPFASSSLAYIGSYGAAGTTTIKTLRTYRPLALLGFYCDTDTGTAYATIGNGVSSTTLQCTTSGPFVASTVTWTMGQLVLISIGTQSGNPNIITLSPEIRKNAD